jgi:DNA-binding NarL/FixJ family response regulator
MNDEPTATDGAPFTVLIVDDVADLRLLVRLALERSGRFQVVAEAEGGLEGIELAGHHRPDLVLLDLSMPDMDGMEALPAVRDAAPDSKVVVLSGFERPQMWPRAQASGAVGYVEKGASPQALVDELLAVAGVMEMADAAVEQARAALTGEPASAGAARRFVDETLQRWDCDAQLEVVRLLVSELVTNAVTHAGSDLEVFVQLRQGALRVEVIDQSDVLPHLQQPEPTDVAGRGLTLVESLTRSWGVETRPTGKSVWFEVPRLDA